MIILYLYIATFQDDFFDADEISTSPEVKAEGLPKIRRPSPIAIRKLDRFMKSNHLRLIDIFRTIDKDKTWTINRDSFTAAIKEVPIDYIQYSLVIAY